MPAPQTVELRQLGDDELRRELEDSHQALFHLRFQTATRQLADVSQVRKERRKIARIKTLMRERDLTLAAVAPPPPSADDNAADESAEETPAAEAESVSDSADAGDSDEAGDGDETDEAERTEE